MFSLSIMKNLAYPLDFGFKILAVAAWAAFMVIFAQVIYGRFDQVAGFNYEQILIITGSIILVDGLSWITCWAGLSELRRTAERGDFDFILIKPMDSQFLQTVARVDLEDVSKIPVGLFLVVSSLLKLDFDFSLANILMYVIMLINGLVIFYSFVLAASTLCFWFIKSEGQWQIMNTFMTLGRYPADIYRGAAKFLFTFIFPVAFLATVPTKILTRPIDWFWVLASCALAAVFFIGSRKIWLVGVRKYSSVG